MIIKKNDQFAVECQTKQSKYCLQNGEYCDSEEEAQEWVEDECWIFSGEGWICLKCNEFFMSNIAKIRHRKGQEGKEQSRPDDDLESGIETVR